MRQLMIASALAAVVGLGCGVAMQSWRDVQKMKSEPCFARKWDPTTRKVVQIHQGEGACYALSDPAVFEGVWTTGLEESSFSDGSWLSVDS